MIVKRGIVIDDVHFAPDGFKRLAVVQNAAFEMFQLEQAFQERRFPGAVFPIRKVTLFFSIFMLRRLNTVLFP